MDGIGKMRAGMFCALTLALGINGPAPAQTRVPAATPVQSTPLQPPAGGAQPTQTTPVPAEPTPVQPPPTPRLPVEPTPVQPPPTPGGPIVPQPVQPAPGAPPAPLPAPPAAPPAQQQTTAPDPNATMAGKAGDTSDVDEVMLVAKPVLVLPGSASWDEGFQKLSQAIQTLRDEAARAALPVAGRPLGLFVETDDNGFRFQAMLPVARLPAGGSPALGNGVSTGMTPAGPSLRFVHQAPYDEVDSTYETIAAYLEAKNIQVKDAFLEEYVSDLKDPADPNLMINVYVQPR